MPKPTPSGVPSYMRRCVVDLVNKGHDLDAAFAICNSTMQKAGYLTSGPDQKQTKKGRERQRHFSAKEDFLDYDKEYEKILAKARKDRAKKSKAKKAPRAVKETSFSRESLVLLSFAEALAGEAPKSLVAEMRKKKIDTTTEAERVRANVLLNATNEILENYRLREITASKSATPRKTAEKAAKTILILLQDGADFSYVSEVVDAAIVDCLRI